MGIEKSRGEDGITAEIIKYSGKQQTGHIHEIMERIYCTYIYI